LFNGTKHEENSVYPIIESNLGRLTDISESKKGKKGVRISGERLRSLGEGQK